MASVLIVDDDPMIVEMLGEMITDFGHTPIPAYEGAAALRLARAQSPALIITDVMMPVLDGYGLLRAVRADATLSEIPVFLMSASFTKRPPLSDAGADGYLPKPFDMGSVEDLLDRLPAR